MKQLSVAQFKKALETDKAIFDSRSPLQKKREPIEEAKSISLEEVQDGKLPDLDKDTPIYLICEYGQFSELIGLYLEEAGFTNVANLAGGMRAFRQAEQTG